MSRGRANSRESGWDSLGKQLKNEILSAVQLLLRNAKQQSVRLLESEALWTSYQISFSPKGIRIPFRMDEAEISPDVVSRLKKMGTAHSLALLTADSAKLQTDGALQAQDVTIKTLTLFNPNSQKNYEIDFSKPEAKITQEKEFKLSTPILSLAIPTSKTTMSRIITGFMGNRRAFNLGARLSLNTTLKNGCRFKPLPITKTSIPMHRFTSVSRHVFRACLAEKYSLAPDNLQVVSVFTQISLRRYSALDRSEKGHLLCTPKLPETTSNSTISQEMDLEEAQSYLVVGLRLDTKQEIHTVVPFGKLKEVLPPTLNPSPAEGGGDSSLLGKSTKDNTPPAGEAP
jgi:hypothetical protein